MRYYRIDLSDPVTKQPIRPRSFGGFGLTSKLPNGQTNPAALNIELDIPVAAYAQPGGGAFVRIWGLGLQDIVAAADLNDKLISIYGGMAAGLPLANPAQAGLLVQGQIFQAFGNWIGTDQTVDLLLLPSTGTVDAPKNIVLNWTAGQSMAAALDVTLLTAFPEAQRIITISPRLVLAHDEVGYYASLTQLAQRIEALSKEIITDTNYKGVRISYDGVTLTVNDATDSAPKVKAISFQDLVGQPTWIAPQVIQATCVMRGDIRPFDVVSLPPSLATTTQQSMLRFQDKTTFSGTYWVAEMHHFGNYRQAEASSWVTVLNLIPLPKT